MPKTTDTAKTSEKHEPQDAPFTISNRFLRLLAHHLFGDSPGVVLRELIQNAHDAVLVRAAKDTRLGVDWGVTVLIDEPRRRIEVIDTGIGMNADDIRKSLTRLGFSSKEPMQLEKQMDTVKNPAMLKNVAGYFGFGFITSMIVSKKVEIWSRAEGQKAVHFQFEVDSERPTFEELDHTTESPEQGTRVILHVDPEKARINDDTIPSIKEGSVLHPDVAEKIIIRYCDLLEFDVRLRTSPTDSHIVTSKSGPWERGSKPSAKDLLTFFKRRFGEGLNQPIDSAVFEFTKEQHGVEAAGVLYIPRPSLRDPSKRDPERLEVFVKRMWVCDDDLSLLPEWAQFFRGVIVSPSLVPTIDRKGLDPLDKGYHDLKIALREYARRYLVELAARNPETFSMVLDSHGAALRFGLFRARAAFEGSRPIWFADLVRTLPFRAYSSKYPSGYETSINDLLGLAPTAPLTRKGDGEKHLLHGVNRVVPPDHQSEFRKVLADKSHPIIVPETDIDLAYLGAIGTEFQEVLSISDVEFRFSSDFVQPLSPEEMDRWQRLVDFVFTDMLRYTQRKDGISGEVKAGGIPKTSLPMLVTWRDRKTNEMADKETAEKEDSSRRDKFQQITTINTSNQFMKDLLSHVEEQKIRRIEQNSLVGTCLYVSYYLALLEQSANIPRATFDEIVFRTMELLRMSLQSEQELGKTKELRDMLQAKAAQAEREIERLKTPPPERIAIPEKPEIRTAAIVFLDLADSTRELVQFDRKDGPEVFWRYADQLRELVEQHDGHFEKFTGDGIVALFGVDAPNADRQRSSTDAYKFAQQALALTNNFGDQKEIRPALVNHLGAGAAGIGVFACRIAIAFGDIGFGRFAGFGSAIGTKMVEAARLCAMSELYPTAGGIRITGDAYFAMGNPPNFEMLHKKMKLRGLANDVDVYKPNG